MGLDRYEIHRGPCRCGKGEFVVVETEPDHPFARASQRGWEMDITCTDCRGEYGLVIQGDYVIIVRQTDIAAARQRQGEWHEGSKALRQRDDVRAIAARLEGLLEACRSRAEAYRLLQRSGFFLGSQSTFGRHWKGASEWVKQNLHSPSDIADAMKVVGVDDPGIATEIARLKELGAEGLLPVVGEPLVRTTYLG